MAGFAAGASEAHTSGADDLPMHWKSAVDKGSGRTYYFHEVTKQTQWDLFSIKKVLHFKILKKFHIL